MVVVTIVINKIDRLNWVEVIVISRMSEAQNTLTNIERLLETLEELDGESYDVSSYIDKLESERSELETAMEEPEHVQASISHTTKKNVVIVLSDMPSDLLEKLVAETEFEASFDDQLPA